MVKDKRPLMSQQLGGGFSQQSTIDILLGRPIHLKIFFDNLLDDR